ncbi:hypothetical protein DFH28DRAFT_949028 [Melampsora americana]|nr:hypothetical protein DFH28DRAFT_949028 [Melampsora americana]
MLKFIFGYILLINFLFCVRALNSIQKNDHQILQLKDSEPIFESIDQSHLTQHRLFKRHSHDGTKRRRVGHAMNKHEFFWKKNRHHY